MIAGAIILLFLYYAQGVVITLLLSILLSYFLDPAVEMLERAHLPRTIGALVMVLLLIAVLAGVGYALWTRTADFAENWPKYSEVMKRAAGAVEGKLAGIEGQVSQIAPTSGAAAPPPTLEPGIVRRPDLARTRFTVCAVSGSDVRALPGVFYAGGKA